VSPTLIPNLQDSSRHPLRALSSLLSPTLDQTLTGTLFFSLRNNNNLAHKDPTDAAQVPPSVLAQTKGAPVVEHDDTRNSRERRHGSVSHQAHGHGL